MSGQPGLAEGLHENLRQSGLFFGHPETGLVKSLTSKRDELYIFGEKTGCCIMRNIQFEFIWIIMEAMEGTCYES